MGNKGIEYNLTRHNIGFMVIDYLNSQYGVSGDNNYQKKFNALFNQIVYKGTSVFLLKPQTYVNLSGKSILEVKRFYQAQNEEIIIVVDDVYLPFGRIKIKTTGSSGGHNGLKSIEDCLGKNYPRIRAGIGATIPATTSRNSNDSPPSVSIPLNKFVLGKFTKEEQKKLPIFIKHLAESCLSMIDSFEKTANFNQAMNVYNGKNWGEI